MDESNLDILNLLLTGLGLFAVFIAAMAVLIARRSEKAFEKAEELLFELIKKTETMVPSKYQELLDSIENQSKFNKYLSDFKKHPELLELYCSEIELSAAISEIERLLLDLDGNDLGELTKYDEKEHTKGIRRLIEKYGLEKAKEIFKKVSNKTFNSLNNLGQSAVKSAMKGEDD